jgi:aerotaxis receptor
MRKNLPVTQREYMLPEGTSLVSKTDLKGRIVYFNPAFVESSGFEREELAGAPHNLVRHPDMPEAAFADLWATLERGLPWSGLVKNRRKNGDHYWVCANVTPVREEGRTVAYMSVRTKPARAEVDAAEALYARMREGTVRGLVLKGGFLLRTGIAGWAGKLRNLSIGARVGAVAGCEIAAIALLAGLAVAGSSAMMVSAAAMLAVAVAVAGGFYLAQNIAKPISAALDATRGLAAGVLSFRTDTQRIDDVGLLLRGLQQVSINLDAVVRDIKSGTASITRATSELSEETHGLSARTEQQAANLEQTAASMEELTSTVKQNADNAKQANQLVIKASEVAARGGAVVGNVITTMAAMSASSKRIADIIGVIDGIAFQTNILALNAAVEAARAGEQGRGFAVVASEVRNLAQRSAAAAKEIKDLITDSVHRVDSGARQVGEAGSTMEEVVASVKRVADIMAEITSASQEQAAGIDQIGQAVNQLDQITQQNAALVEEAAAATETMRNEASALDGAVDVFHIAGFQAAAGAAHKLAARAVEKARAPKAPVRPPLAKKPAAPAAAALPSAGGSADEWAEF